MVKIFDCFLYTTYKIYIQSTHWSGSLRSCGSSVRSSVSVCLPVAGYKKQQHQYWHGIWTDTGGSAMLMATARRARHEDMKEYS